MHRNGRRRGVIRRVAYSGINVVPHAELTKARFLLLGHRDAERALEAGLRVGCKGQPALRLQQADSTAGVQSTGMAGSHDGIV